MPFLDLTNKFYLHEGQEKVNNSSVCTIHNVKMIGALRSVRISCRHVRGSTDAA